MVAKVLISGASGYLALHIIGKLLSEGYSVIGTVRSETKATRLKKLFDQQFANASLEFFIVPDISLKGAFDSVLQTNKDIKYVLHTASPFSFGNLKSFEEAFKNPAVDGTLNMLSSIKNFAPQVEKVVITSSMAAIENADKLNDPTFIHTESTWNPIEWEQVTNENLAYVCSKKLAEKAAWNFVGENAVNYKLNTVNPPFIFGPQFFNKDISLENLNTSSSVILNLMRSDPNDSSLFDKLALCSVDVRDVAAFHVLALNDSIGEQRLSPVCSRFSEQGILDIINDYFPQLKGKIAKGDPDHEKTIPTPAFNNDKTKDLVGGYEFKTLETQVIDTVNQILNFTNF